LNTKALVSGTAPRTKKKELTTDPDVELESSKQHMIKITDLGKLIALDTEETKPNVITHAHKDFAGSIKFLNLEE
jgi:hypothetical protein